MFFEIHDPAQLNRQGPDVGSQYRSAIFYTNDGQKRTALALVELLRAKGYKISTEVVAASEFYPAEEYHQDYLKKHPDRPSCHRRVKRFQPDE